MATVFLGIYGHYFGRDVAVYATYEAAVKGRDEIARQFWEGNIGTSMPDQDIGDAYFAQCEDEWFEIEPRELVE